MQGSTIPPSLKVGKVGPETQPSTLPNTGEITKLCLANNVDDGVRIARADVGEDRIAMG